MKKVIFYNHFNNGDIHVSREFVRQIIYKLASPNIDFVYSHKNDPRLIIDIPDLRTDKSFLSTIGIEYKSSVIGENLFINTWYASQKHKYMNRYGITFDCLYFLFDDICKERLGFSLQDLSADPKVFFPSINYVEYYIKPLKEWVSRHHQKKIFVSNGPALSGQAHNFNMSQIIKTLAKNYPEIIFILTNKEEYINQIEYNNIVYSADIIQKSGSDLNENGYLSTFCDVIIGRASGSFSFAVIRDNLFNRQVKFLCFSNLIPQRSNKFWLGEHFQDKIDYTANIIVSNENDTNKICAMIERSL